VFVCVCFVLSFVVVFVSGGVFVCVVVWWFFFGLFDCDCVCLFCC
jgi:hypothetical protein